MTESSGTSRTLPTAGPPELNLDSINAGTAIAQSKKEPDDNDKEEASGMRKAQVDALLSQTKMREGYERKVYRYLVGYSLGSAAIVLASGLHWLSLPDNVLLVLVGSTAVSAISLVSQIGKGLFDSH